MYNHFIPHAVEITLGITIITTILLTGGWNRPDLVELVILLDVGFSRLVSPDQAVARFRRIYLQGPYPCGVAVDNSFIYDHTNWIARILGFIKYSLYPAIPLEGYRPLRYHPAQQNKIDLELTVLAGTSTESAFHHF